MIVRPIHQTMPAPIANKTMFNAKGYARSIAES